MPDPWHEARSQIADLHCRYEKAWQRLFKYETAFRKANNDNTPVTGMLTTNKNVDEIVRDPPKPLSLSQPFDKDDDLTVMYENFRWMAFAIYYRIKLDGHSFILRRGEPECVVQFWPFTRFCFTKLENDLDDKILSHLCKTAKVDKFSKTAMELEDEGSTGIGIESHPAGRMAGVVPAHVERGLTVDGELEVQESDTSNVLAGNQTVSLDEPNASNPTRQQELQSDEERQAEHDTNENGLIEENTESASIGQQDLSAPMLNWINNGETNSARWDPSPKISLHDEKAIFLGTMPVTNLQVQILQPDGSILLQETTVVPQQTMIADMQPFMFEPKTERALEDPFCIFVPVPISEASTAVSTADMQATSAPMMEISSIVPSQQKVDMFIVEADCQLFGFIPAKIKSRQGLLLDGETVRETVVPIQPSISLGTVFPSLRGSLFDVVAVDNPTFTYAERTLDLAEPAGVRLTADLLFQNKLAPVSDALKNLFNMATPSLHMEAYLGPFVDWQNTFQASSLVFRGSFEAMTLALGDMMTIRRLGVELSCVKQAATKGIS